MPRKRSPTDADHAGEARSAYDRALGMLARREYSRRELRTRLERAGCDGAESESALRQLGEQHYQDDTRFGEMLVRTRVAQGYGPARIRAELRTHNLPDPAIRRLLGAAEVDWAELAAAQLCKKYGGRAPADYAERAKRAAFLLRRGFAAETVRIVVPSVVGDPGD